jgi:hypothetical protein
LYSQRQQIASQHGEDERTVKEEINDAIDYPRYTGIRQYFPAFTKKVDIDQRVNKEKGDKKNHKTRNKRGKDRKKIIKNGTFVSLLKKIHYLIVNNIQIWQDLVRLKF